MNTDVEALVEAKLDDGTVAGFFVCFFKMQKEKKSLWK